MQTMKSRTERAAISAMILEHAPRLVETRFGPLEFDPANTVTMPQGLIGYSEFRDFGLLRLPDAGTGPLLLLQSLSEASLSFIVMPYAPSLEIIDRHDLDEALKALRIPADDATVLLVVTVRREGDAVRLSANLRAPIIVDNRTHVGRQYVLPNPKYPVRHML